MHARPGSRIEFDGPAMHKVITTLDSVIADEFQLRKMTWLRLISDLQIRREEP